MITPRRQVRCLAAFLAVMLPVGVVSAQDAATAKPFDIVAGMGITQNLGKYVPAEATFKDEKGATVKIGDIMSARPTLLIPTYYNSQDGCNTLLDGVAKAIAKLNPSGRTNRINVGNATDLAAGKDFDIILLSLNPTETPKLAAEREKQVLEGLNNTAFEKGWHFLTGDMANIRKVSDAIGLKFYYNAEKKILNYPTMTAVVSKQLKVCGYTIANDFPTKVFETNLAAAQEDKPTERADQSQMFGCITPDASAGKYSPIIKLSLLITGIGTALVVAVSILNLAVKNKRTPIYRNSVNAPKSDQDGGSQA
jgi:protein SCO1/2